VAEISSGTVAIATMVVLLALMFVSGLMFKNQFESPRVTFTEAELSKNKELQLSSGEDYMYMYGYLLNNTTVNITYSVMKGNGCTVIRLMDSVNKSEICVYKGGSDKSGSNATYANPAILMFKPWMLAVNESWHWNNTMYMIYDDSKYHIADTEYRVIRTEYYRGRMSHVVMINSTVASPEYQWIDEEKRVMLRTIGDTYEIVLMKGLPLE
jgi:hypothetical protein